MHVRTAQRDSLLRKIQCRMTPGASHALAQDATILFVMKNQNPSTVLRATGAHCAQLVRSKAIVVLALPVARNAKEVKWNFAFR